MAVMPADQPRYLLLIMLDEPHPTPESHGFKTSGWNAVPTGGAVVPLLMLLFVLGTLILKAIPAIRFSGGSFFTGTTWNFGSQYGKPVTSDGVTHLPGEVFGALPEILGTLATSAIALIIGVPVAVSTALFVTELCPRRARGPLAMMLDLLAAVPSVVYGLWGVFVLGPTLEPVERTDTTSALRRLAASSKLELVRVEAS